MNLKDWEKILEEDDVIIMRHPKGHTMKIASSALPRIQREQLKRLPLAHGGHVKPEKAEGISVQGKDVRYKNKLKKAGADHEKQEMARDFARDEAKGRAAEERFVKPKMKGLADGGEVEKDSQDQAQPDVIPQTEQKPDQGGTVININAAQPGQAAPAPQPAVQAQAPQAPASSYLKPMAQPVMPQVEPVTPTEPVPVNGSSLSKEAYQSLSGIEKAKAATQTLGDVEAAKARAAVPVIQQDIQRQQEIANQNANAYKEVAQVTDDFRRYVKENPINPKAYQENMSSGAKTAAAIGLFLGGLGTPFGGKNYAMEHLERQIDRDIEGQKSRLEQQKTILGAYQQLYGDNNISTALAKAAQADIYAKQMSLIAAQVGTPEAKAKAELGINKLNQDSSAWRNEAATLLGGYRAAGQPLPGQKQPVSGKAEQAKPGEMKPTGGLKMTPEEKAKEDKLRPGSAVAPKLDEPPLVKINYNKLKQSQFLGQKGIAGEVTPGELGEVNNAINYVESVNQAIHDIRGSYEDMWKHGGQADLLTTGLEGVQLGPIHVPNVGKAIAPVEMKEYYMASANVEKILGNLVKGGLNPSTAEQIMSQLVQRLDTPDQYRKKIKNVEKLLLRSIPQATLKKYNLASGLPE